MGEFSRSGPRRFGSSRGGPRKSFGSSRGGFRSGRGGFGSSRGGFRRDFGPREMHKAVCSDCGKECEVPFKPTKGKPVFCQECYRKRKGF